MINANMMYLRPGNLFKEFVIENNRQKVTSTGRVVNDHKGDGIKTLYGLSLIHISEPTRP